MKIYLASPFFSDEQVERVKRVEQALKDNPTVQDFFSPRLNQLDQYEFGSKEWSEAVFKNDVDHIDWCNAVVAVHDFTGETELHGQIHQHVDSGTAWELGYAYATGKPIILIHEKGGIVNLMLAEGLHGYLTKAEDVAEYDFSTLPLIEFKGEVL
ncbi:nucleoside 2-deoxyribosyltransferase [Priestia aryabhattai]|uniref:nucleoside 2-deoxyribosyltransferase n=1 Tax=Priestia aryabhattai TaxID=412384 RepID=UPI00203E8AEA|nr:nucleoside 2-deoxyribosyltransferase [Priestia aryabhattai]MCM3639654.1 nucleoside 2-deoxyribosyltransferase [Priestia aryabhattai]